MTLIPRSLFGRTALLIGLVLFFYSTLVWQAVMWTVVVPNAQANAEVIAERAQQALTAHQTGVPLPAGVRFAQGTPEDVLNTLGRSAYGVYMRRVRDTLRRALDTQDVVIVQARAPAQIWIRTAESGSDWLIITTRLASAAAPVALILVLVMSALLVLGVAAWSTRRLTTPLAHLARDAGQVARGESIRAVDASAPSEVRALALALQSMSAQLHELNEQRELMLAGISHDLRSPLARLRVALELLDPRDGELAQTMVIEIEEMDRMVGQFLQYVRAGYREAPKPAVPDQVITDALAAHSSEQGLQLQLAAPASCGLCVEALRHIVLNLVQNALEHGKPPIRVSTRLRGSDLELVVGDAGAGISAQDWPQALRAFDRLQATANAGHSGLGLALVARLVQAAHGTISSRQLPGGFEICVVLAGVRAATHSAAR